LHAQPSGEFACAGLGKFDDRPTTKTYIFRWRSTYIFQWLLTTASQADSNDGYAGIMTFLQAAEEVLRKAKTPLTAREITDLALRRGYFGPVEAHQRRA